MRWWGLAAMVVWWEPGEAWVGPWQAPGMLSIRGAQQQQQQAEETESKSLLTRGNALYLRGQLDGAVAAYSRCVSLGEFPWACDCAVNLGSVILDRDGDEAGAEMLYRSALAAAEYGNWPVPEGAKKDPPGRPALSFFHVDAAHNLASLLQTMAAAATKSDDRQRSLRQAAELYRKVVLTDESRWDAWANLGSAMIDAGLPRLDAAKCLQRAILLAEKVETEYEKNRDGRLTSVLHALATAYYGLGSALAHLTPDEARQALHDDELVLLDGSDDPLAESASNALRTALALSGGDARLRAKAEHALAAVRHEPTKRASPAFVRALFDEFASTFDEQLLNDLDYHVPELLAERARERRPESGYDVALDAGCGTGLLGVSGLAVARLVGADISSKMCAASRAREWADGTKVYNLVLEGDLLDPELYVEALGGNARFDLIAAADVLCYFGDLEPILALWAAALGPGGDAIFTVEALPEKSALPWELASSGRYAHSTDHVRQAAQKAGLELAAASSIVARLERGEPVQATLVVLHKRAPATTAASGA